MNAGRLLYLDEVMRWVLAADLQLERLQMAIRAHSALPPPDGDELSADGEVVQAQLRADTHLFFNALAQVVKALEEDAYGPRLPPWPEPLRTDIKHLRDLLEHWEQARKKGAPPSRRLRLGSSAERGRVSAEAPRRVAVLDNHRP